MQYYAVLNGNVLEFQKKEPDTPEYIACSEEQYDCRSPWGKYQNRTESIRFLDTITPVSTAYWFCGFRYLKEFNCANLDLSQASDIQGMFGHCNSLQALDLSGLDVSGVKKMADLFSGCTQLTQINLEGWDTSGVEDFSQMFAYCSALTHLDISSLSMKSVRNICCRFYNCTALKSLIFPNFTEKKHIYIGSLCEGCESLQNIDLRPLKGPFFQGTHCVLKGCESLSDIRISADSISILKEIFKDLKGV